MSRAEVSEQHRTVFVISPIGEEGSDNHRRFLTSLNYIIHKALPEASGWKVMRADDESAPDSITDRVIRRISESDLIVADLTDHNPNVFYELAVAHGFGKPVVHLIEKGQSIPFDVNDQRCISYRLADPASVDSAITSLRASAESALDPAYVPRSPLTEYDRFANVETVEGDGDSIVAGAMQELSQQVAILTRRVERFAREADKRILDPMGRMTFGSASSSENFLSEGVRRIANQSMEKRMAEEMAMLNDSRYGAKITPEIAESD